MGRPCLDTPEWLWLSSQPVRTSGRQYGHAKMPWTPELAVRAQAMHDAGDPWAEVAQMLEVETGVHISVKGVADYLSRHAEEGKGGGSN